jgi:hypothetical protein
MSIPTLVSFVDLVLDPTQIVLPFGFNLYIKLIKNKITCSKNENGRG